MADEREEAEKSTQTYAALGVGFVCIIVGLPLWWKTTEVYRVQLPYTEIHTLDTAHVKYNVDFTAIMLDLSQSEKDLAIFGGKLKNAFENIDKSSEILSANYRGLLRIGTESEQEVYKNATNLQELDRLFSGEEYNPSSGKYHIVLLPGNGHIKMTKPYIGRGRTVFVPIGNELDSAIPVVMSLIRDTLVNEGAISKAFFTARGTVLSQANKEDMRSLRLYPGYEVTFTLLNPQPDEMQAEWDIKQAINDYMDPMLKALSPYTDINIKSQYLHNVPLGIFPNKDDASGEYRLNQDQLPHIINPIEAYLSSHVSINPNLNFVLYVTPRSHYPLHIHDPTGESAGNSFLSPRWGGIMVYNTPLPEDVPRPAPVTIDMKPVMEVFLYQLRLLLGVNPQSGSIDIEIAQPGQNVISEWELDQWLRLRAIENIATSVSTLRSLSQLLEEISNIVINDDIGREVERAVQSIHTAITNLHHAHLTEAFVFARQALLSSENAFFDQSLLELLYFPEDQKFAIYIPLFLPISIPVIMSIIQAFKRLRQKVKVKDD